MCVRDERTEMADVTRQKAAETDAQPQAEVCHQIPEETDTPMEEKTQELRQDAPVYPEAEYDDYEDAQEDWMLQMRRVRRSQMRITGSRRSRIMTTIT